MINRLLNKYSQEEIAVSKLGIVCRSIKTGKLNANAMKSDGHYPFFTCDAHPYRIDTYAFDMEAIMVSGNGSQIGHINYYKGKFNAYQRTYVLSDFSSECDVFYLLHYLKSYLKGYILKNSKKGSVPYITLPLLESFKIPLPPLPVQQEIVRILDSFTDLQDNLQQELEVRKKQGVVLKKRMLSESLPSSIDYYSLSECCTKTSNIKWKTQEDNEYNYIDLSSVDITHMEIGETSLINKTNAPSRAQQIVREGDILIGTTRPTQKRICLVPPKYDGQICSTGFCVVRANRDVVLPKWIFHIITEGSFWEYAEKVQKGASYPSMSNAEVLAFQIPLPTLSAQKEIIEQLDAIDSLIRNISLEIDVRQKQYEYYREQLLKNLITT